MRVRKKPATSSRFTKSVNLEHDLSRPESLDGYVVTSGVRRALLRVASPSRQGSRNRAITLTGPYGSGKSAFALFCSHLLAPTWWSSQPMARRLLHEADRNAEGQLFSASEDSAGLLPVVVTGSREPLTTAIIRGLLRSFEMLKGQRVQRHVDTLRKHLRKAAHGRHLDSRALGTVLEDSVALANYGHRPFRGIFLTLDELGKLLEFAAANPTEADAFVLQSVAEFAVRCESPFLFAGVLHQDFSAYVDRLAATDRVEWEKVRGRFEDCAFEEPADEVLRLVAHARRLADQPAAPLTHRTSRASQFADTSFKSLVGSAAKLDLAPSSVSAKEFAQLLTACHPLHPLVAVLIGPLFRKLAQNERSVCSFLDSVEPNGLRDFMSKPSGSDDGVYRTDRLYDFLVTSLGPVLYSHAFGKRWAEIDAVLARLPDAIPLDIFLVKTIGLLGAVGQWRHLRATREVLKFASAGIATPAEVNDRLNALRSASALVFRRFNASFSLWEGSDLDIDDLLKSAAARLPKSASSAALAEKHLNLRPLVARRHSFQTGTLRFFAVHFATPQTLSTLATQLSFGDADGALIVVLPEHGEDVGLAINAAGGPEWGKRPQHLIAIATEPAALPAALRDYALLLDVQQHTAELAGDPAARRELRVRIASARQRMDDALSAILTPREVHRIQCKWFHRGKVHQFSSQRDLNECLSRICSHVFSKTPRIRNELINRRDLSSAAAAARRNLIEAMIDHGVEENLGIVGTPPEMSMYLSLLKVTGIHRRSRTQYCFGPPAKDSDAGVQAAWRMIQHFFSTSDSAPANVADLFRILQDPPFGMKAGPLPVLLCAALLALDSEVALYEEGTFIPRLTIAVFERLLRSPSRFSVQQWKVAGVRMAVFEKLSQLLLPPDTNVTKTGTQLLAVVRPLCRVASTLNEYSRTTAQLSPAARGVRDALLRATKPDQLLFVDLPAACGFTPFKAVQSKNADAVDQFISVLRKALEELRGRYAHLLREITLFIGQVFSTAEDAPSIRKALVDRARLVQPWVADPKLSSFLGRLLDGYLTDEAWVESVAALVLQRPPSVWKDDDLTRFEVSLAAMVRHFRHVEALAYESRDIAEGDEALRVGITMKSAPDIERVIRISANQRTELQNIQASLMAALGPAAMNGHAEIAAAALIQLAQKLLIT